MKRIVNIPILGRHVIQPDTFGTGEVRGAAAFTGHLDFQAFRHGRPLKLKEYMNLSWFDRKRFGDNYVFDAGSGKVTNVGVNLMAWNDATSVLGATLSLMQYHAIGTGSTADAAADYYLQTPQGTTNLSGTTNGYMTGAPAVTAPNQIKTSATFTLTGNIAISEWVLAMSNAANFSRTASGTPTATTFPDSGAAFTTSGNGLKGWTIEIASSAVNTPTTTVQGLVTSNTATQLNLAGGWWTLANASGSTPGANVAYVVYPTAWDHRQFSTVNLGNGDTFQVNYTLTINSGG